MRLRFSLRSLLVLTVVGAIASLVAYKQHTDLAPKRLVAELNEHRVQPILNDFDLGHFVEEKLTLEHLTEPDNHTFMVGLRFERVASSRALFLASQLSDYNILDVREHEPAVTPNHCDFSHLTSLTLGGFTEAQLSEWLEVADQLEHLYLFRVDTISLANYQQLANARQLQALMLSGMDITPKELETLNKLQSLQHLRLVDCRIERGALAEFRSHPSLTELYLDGSSCDDELIRELSILKRVTKLGLDDSLISDQAIKQLVAMDHLRVLDLYCCPNITERCIPDLMNMKFLDSVNLLGTSIEEHPTLNDAPFFMPMWEY